MLYRLIIIMTIVGKPIPPSGLTDTRIFRQDYKTEALCIAGRERIYAVIDFLNTKVRADPFDLPLFIYCIPTYTPLEDAK